MALKEYRCRLDNFSATGTVGIPEVFFEHMEQKHAVNVLVAGRELARKWIAEHVEERQIFTAG